MWLVAQRSWVLALLRSRFGRSSGPPIVGRWLEIQEEAVSAPVFTQTAHAKLVQHWSKRPKPSVAQGYAKSEAIITPDGKGGATLRFDSSNLRWFYLYDVLTFRTCGRS